MTTAKMDPELVRFYRDRWKAVEEFEAAEKRNASIQGEMMNTQISVEELTNVLEPLIRRVVREELAQLVAKEPGTFYLRPETPLYQDMETILKQKAEGKVKLYSHQEVWSE